MPTPQRLCQHNCKGYTGLQRMFAFQLQACNKRVRRGFTSKLPEISSENIAQDTGHQLMLPRGISVIKNLAQLLLRIVRMHKHKAAVFAL